MTYITLLTVEEATAAPTVNLDHIDSWEPYGRNRKKTIVYTTKRSYLSNETADEFTERINAIRNREILINAATGGPH